MLFFWFLLATSVMVILLYGVSTLFEIQWASPPDKYFDFKKS